MARSDGRALRKRPDRYHHGDLRRALVREAVRTIQQQGVEKLTLRSVGKHLGVSRTALYRHFADKSALVAAVACEGFRTLRQELSDVWNTEGRGLSAFEAMSVAYVRFALAHPSHYRVMFGGLIEVADSNAELREEGAGAFQVLVDALVTLQAAAFVRDEEPIRLARFIWSVVHGIAMLAIDGRLGFKGADLEDFVRYSAERLRSGIVVPSSSP